MMNKNDCYRRETCRLCKDKDVELAFSLKPTPPGDAFLKSIKLGIKLRKVEIQS